MSKAIDPAVNDSLAPFGLDPRSPRASGFVTPNKHVTPGDERSATDGIEDTIRTANTDLQLRSGEHLTLPLTIAVEQRDAAYRQLQVEREAWHAQHQALVTNHAAELRERDTTLDTLRQQLRDSERELAALRDDPRTVIGMAPVSTRMAALQSQDSGEHRLQTSLESAREDVQDLQARLSAMELERDDAVREADDLRIEVYSKLATVRDEVAELEARLVESQRSLVQKDEQWQTERNRWAAEVEEIRQALHAQVQANIELRRAIAERVSGYAPPEAAIAGVAYPAGSALGGVSIPPVQTSAPLYEPATELPNAAMSSPSTQQPDVWGGPLPIDSRFGVPEAAPPPTFASLVGFDTSAPDAGDAALEAASALDLELQEVNRRSRGFGLSRLFQRTK
jgi:hypothetical protein